LWGNLREGDYLKDPDVDGRIVLNGPLRSEGMDWIDLAQDRDRWRSHVNAVINLLGPKKCGNFLTS
jgi:hypothetical protein